MENAGGWAPPQAPSLNSGLSFVEVYTSCVLSAEAEATWRIVRNWGSASWFKGEGDLFFDLVNLGKGSATEVGSLRLFRVGESQMFEQLTALDDEGHVVRWKLISHPQTVSPFQSSSFLNQNSSISLKPVTVGKSTFMEWKVQFFTEAHNAQHMRMTLETWCHIGFRNLQACLLSELRGVPGNGGVGSAYHNSRPSFSNAKPQPRLYQQTAEARGGYSAFPAKQGSHPLSGQFPSTSRRHRVIGTMSEDADIDPAVIHLDTCGPPVYQEAPWEAQRAAEAPAAIGGGFPLGLDRDRLRLGGRRVSDTCQKQELPSDSGRSNFTQSVNSNLYSGSSYGQRESADSRNSSWGSGNQEKTGAVPPLNSKQFSLLGKGSNCSSLMDASHYSVDVQTKSSSTSGGSEKQAKEQSNDDALCQAQCHQPSKAALSARNPSSNAEQNMDSLLHTDDVYVDKLTQQLETNWLNAKDTASRTSFEEAAARLEERHRLLHKAKKQPPGSASGQSPFASPFAGAFTSPFGEHPPAADQLGSAAPSVQGLGKPRISAGKPSRHMRQGKHSSLQQAVAAADINSPFSRMQT